MLEARLVAAAAAVALVSHLHSYALLDTVRSNKGVALQVCSSLPLPLPLGYHRAAVPAPVAAGPGKHPMTSRASVAVFRCVFDNNSVHAVSGTGTHLGLVVAAAD
jgi:hypothetical protein